MPGVKFGGKNCFAVLSTKWRLSDVLQLGGLTFISMLYVINKLLHVKSQIIFIYSFLIPYRSLARRLARLRYGIKSSCIKTISGS